VRNLVWKRAPIFFANFFFFNFLFGRPNVARLLLRHILIFLAFQVDPQVAACCLLLLPVLTLPPTETGKFLGNLTVTLSTLRMNPKKMPEKCFLFSYFIFGLVDFF
jgi:hypothetical protein